MRRTHLGVQAAIVLAMVAFVAGRNPPVRVRPCGDTLRAVLEARTSTLRASGDARTQPARAPEGMRPIRRRPTA